MILDQVNACVGNVLPLRFPLRDPPPPQTTDHTNISGLGSSVLFAWPELATITGVQGVIVYAASASLPLLMFAWVGSIIRKKTPEGFVLTEWTRQRYGTAAMLYLSFATLVTLFLYLTAELSAVGQVVATLTSVKPLPVMIVQVVVTAIYTCEPPPIPGDSAFRLLMTLQLWEASGSLSSQTRFRPAWSSF